MAFLPQVFSFKPLSKNTTHVTQRAGILDAGLWFAHLLIFNHQLTLTLEDKVKEMILFLSKI